MGWIAFKYLITAGMVVLISEVAKRHDRLGALVASLPLVSILVLIWLYLENSPPEKISSHAFYTFWYVLPTLPMFLLFPWGMQRFGFWLTLVLGVLITLLSFGLCVSVADVKKRFGVALSKGFEVTTLAIATGSLAQCYKLEQHLVKCHVKRFPFKSEIRGEKLSKYRIGRTETFTKALPKSLANLQLLMDSCVPS
ncbi:MAG: DUF3147 family protein [Limnobacter sp.]|nr:DUF3147 family protein [Limnobacter sp.]